jgi:hypothetical protein
MLSVIAYHTHISKVRGFLFNFEDFRLLWHNLCFEANLQKKNAKVTCDRIIFDRIQFFANYARSDQ